MTPRIDHNQELCDLLDDPTCPFWVQNLVPIILQKDPVDVANAAEVLSKILDRRLEALLLIDPPEIELIPTLVELGFEPIVIR